MALRISTVILIIACGAFAAGADWPAFRHDNHRTNATSEKIDASSLTKVWTHMPAHEPRPAWPGPARWDAYVKRPVISSMRNYDVVYHTVAVGDALYYSSSADDAVHCLDAKTGAERWRFTTGGPVRIPPTHSGGRLFFGSDDGFAYCITADKGELMWKFSPTPGRRLVLNDGRLISRWPVRTGVMVRDGIAYFGASLLPWKESYLCALDAATEAHHDLAEPTAVRDLEPLHVDADLHDHQQDRGDQQVRAWPGS